MQIKIIPPVEPIKIEIRDKKRCNLGCSYMNKACYFDMFWRNEYCKKQKLLVDNYPNDISNTETGWCYCVLFKQKLRVELKVDIEYNVTDLSIYRALACVASKVVHSVPEYEAALKLNDELTKQGLTKPRGNMLAGEGK